MTTAHRPTFDPARGKDAQRGPAYHQRLLPAHMTLKTRQPGQGGIASGPRDLRAELLQAEAAHFARKNGGSIENGPEITQTTEKVPAKRRLEDVKAENGDGGDATVKTEEGEEDAEAKRRRLILEEAKDVDADSEEDSSSDESSDEEDDDDEMSALFQQMERIKKERAEQKAKEEAEEAAREQEKREYEIARGNPLLNPQDFNVKRRWDDDVVFKNQARGTEDKNKRKEFVNDLLRSDFHKRFMSKYVR